MTYRKRRRRSATWSERRNPNEHDRTVPVRQPSLAIDAVCVRGGSVDSDLEEEPCAHALLAVAGGFGQVSDSLFADGCGGEPARMAGRTHSGAPVVYGDGTVQPA